MTVVEIIGERPEVKPSVWERAWRLFAWPFRAEARTMTSVEYALYVEAAQSRAVIAAHERRIKDLEHQLELNQVERDATARVMVFMERTIEAETARQCAVKAAAEKGIVR